MLCIEVPIEHKGARKPLDYVSGVQMLTIIHVMGANKEAPTLQVNVVATIFFWKIPPFPHIWTVFSLFFVYKMKLLNVYKMKLLKRDENDTRPPFENAL